MKKKLILVFIIFNCYILLSANIESGYKDIKFNMSKDSVIELIKKSDEFDNKKDEAIIIRFEPDTEIITAFGKIDKNTRSFIKKGFFHFSDDKLYLINLNMDEKRIGYYNLLKHYTDKYGKPVSLDPNNVIWEDSNTRIILEKKSTVKFIDINKWNELLKQEREQEDKERETRENFIKNM